MSKRVSYIITDHHITVNYDGQTHIVPRTDKLSDKLILALREKRDQEIPNLVSASKRIEKFGQGDFTVQSGKIFVKGQEAPTVLGNKIFRFSNEGLPHEPLVRFAENLLKNPSFRAVNELFQFLEKNDHPITDTGCFIAYKKVRSDFMDAYTGKFDNSIGKVVEIPRNQVDEDSSQTCSHGLHVANWDYANNVYSAGDGAVMLEVEVNPADVVAVPADYNQAKMRVCKYLVLGVVNKEHSEDISLRNTAVKSNQKDQSDFGTCDNCGADCKPDEEYCDQCHETCESCGATDCYDYECEDEEGEACDTCGETNCYDYECEKEEEEETEDRYPWETELE
jgi:hypothetical protein